MLCMRCCLLRYCRACIHVCMHVSMYVCMYVCMCLSVCVCVCVCVNTYVYTYVCVYIYIHIYVYIQTCVCVYIYIHTHTHALYALLVAQVLRSLKLQFMHGYLSTFSCIVWCARIPMIKLDLPPQCMCSYVSMCSYV